MDNKVQEFLNDNFGEVRCIEFNNEVWFVASDVSNILEYNLATDMTRKLDDDEKDMRTLHTLGGDQKMTIINESGLYSAVLSVTKKNTQRYEKAKEFKKWVTKDVIPSIRKDGAYINGEEQLKEGNLSEDEFILKAMNILNNKVERLRKENTELKTENDSMKPIVTVAEKFLNTNNTYDIGTFAKILDIKNFGRNKMFAWLKENKILMLNNIPYQTFSKYFNIITTEKNGRTFTKTMIKATGIKYIYNKLYKSGMIVEKPIEQIIKELKQTA